MRVEYSTDIVSFRQQDLAPLYDALVHTAIHAVKPDAGYRWVVDADIEQFFDTLDHQELMAALGRRIADGSMLRLIYRCQRASAAVSRPSLPLSYSAAGPLPRPDFHR